MFGEFAIRRSDWFQGPRGGGYPPPLTFQGPRGEGSPRPWRNEVPFLFLVYFYLFFSSKSSNPPFVPLLVTQPMNFISKGFSTQNYSGSTSFSCLASAASLVAIFWFQLEKSAGEVRRPKLQILWRNWWSKDNNSLSSSRNQLTFIYFYLTTFRPPPPALKWVKGRGHCGR